MQGLASRPAGVRKARGGQKVRTPSTQEIQRTPERDDSLRRDEVSNSGARMLDQQDMRARRTRIINVYLPMVIRLAMTSLVLFAHRQGPARETKTDIPPNGGLPTGGQLGKASLSTEGSASGLRLLS